MRASERALHANSISNLWACARRSIAQRISAYISAASIHIPAYSSLGMAFVLCAYTYMLFRGGEGKDNL